MILEARRRLAIPWPRCPSGEFKARVLNDVLVGDMLQFDDQSQATKATIFNAHAVALENAATGDEVTYLPLSSC